MLRASKADKTYIEAAKTYRCDTCEQTKRKPRTHKVSMPKPYEFNHEVGMDVVDIKDAAGKHFDILNAVDYGTTFQQAWIVRESDIHGSPSSSSCLKLSSMVGRAGPDGLSLLLVIEASTIVESLGPHFLRKVYESGQQDSKVRSRWAG